MIRAVDLRSAVAVNVITMIGAGPLITIPLIVAALHGSISLWAWIAGAIVAACDGLVYAELASLYPASGGTYVYLREAFGAARWGRFVAFLFVWQYVFWAPLVIASGYIGFAQYAAYLVPALANQPLRQGGVAAAVGLFTLAVLYRPITVAVRISLVLGGVAVATVLAVALAGLVHPHVAVGTVLARAVAAPPAIAALGAALLVTLYDYSGYNDVCALGDEVVTAKRTIPRAIIISVALVAALYLALNVGVFSIATPAETMHSTFIASVVVERSAGVIAAEVVTVAILVTAFASTFGLLLASARIPFAAARDGNFLSLFGTLHPRGRFPATSLVVIGALALPAAFFPLDTVIAALSAGIALVQGVAQVVALFALRANGMRAPFRCWGFPLTPLCALAGWLFLFANAGAPAIGFAAVTLAAGCTIYVVRAARRREWPFALAVSCAVAFAAMHTPPASAAGFTASALTERDGTPQLVVDGRPFFLNGAAFFYERIPREEWRPSMERLEAIGINTIDLYIPWNWHELADGDFDFDGHTNPRRDLRTVLALAREFRMRVVVRPGPVIRNEWRNGGYPAWLLARAEYGMPQHDLFEGRYPPTATLQNANSDDAAAQWLGNATHLRYSERWLRRVASELRPFGDRVIAWQIDDDQGAYIDNQTWPAPHLQRYLTHLASVVHAATSPLLPVYINTYEMKVTASSPVWAMGNWYQSDTYAIGEHDRASLEFATGLLATQPHRPLAMSEFQAGWLEDPGDVLPRAADPANTTLALHTLLGMGMHGVIHFPAQDTVYPAGWEVPFANAFYSWDAALQPDPARANPRLVPTAAFGALLVQFGDALAQTHRVADAAVAWLPSALDERNVTNADVFALAARTQLMQQRCRTMRLACDLVDLRYADAATLARYPMLVVPAGALPANRRRLDPRARAALAAFAARAPVFADAPIADVRAAVLTALGAPLRGRDREDALARGMLDRARHERVVDVPGAAVLAGGHRAFLDIVNYDAKPERFRDVIVAVPGRPRIRLVQLDVPARDALFIPLDSPEDTVYASAFRTPSTRLTPAPEAVPLRSGVPYPAPPPLFTPRSRAIAYRRDVYRDGEGAIVLENDAVRVVLAPDAGGRGFVFEDKATGRNAFTTVGAWRDDVSIQPPLSTTDKIGKYTRTFPAGFFNRSYDARIVPDPADAIVALHYRAPDVVPAGAEFDRVVRLRPHARTIEVASRMCAASGPRAADQRLVSTTSLVAGDPREPSRWSLAAPLAARFAAGATRTLDADGAAALYDERTKDFVAITWPAGDVEGGSLEARRDSAVTRLRFAPGGYRLAAYTFESAPTLDRALARLDALRHERGVSEANAPNAGEVAKWYTQSPQKRPSESSCGFESHLPQAKSP